MKHFTLFILLCTLIISGCGESQKNSGPLPTIDLTAQYPKKDIVLQDIADVEYISLNGKDAPLIGNVQIGYIANDCYILYDVRDGDVFVLEKNGTVRSHFNLKGNSGKEYLFLSHLSYDPKKREIYILDGVGPNGILVYTETGTFVRSFPELAQQNLAEIYDFDDQSLLAYFRPLRQPDPDNINQNTPYVFISKQDGAIESRLPLNFPKRLSNTVVIRTDDGQSLGISISSGRYRKYGDDFIIDDLSSDTLYTLSKARQLTPILARTPSVFAQDPFVAWSVELKTDKFIFMTSTVYDFEAIKQQYLKNQPTSLKSETFIYYFSNREIVTPKFVNADLPSKEARVGSSAGTKNMSARILQAESLVDALKKGELTGKLKEVVRTLKEDDNPVLMLVRYK